MRIFTIWHYDWSEPEVIRWTAKRLYRGGGQITIAPTPEGGSALDVVFAHRHPEGVKGAFALSAQRMIGPRIIPRLWQEALDRLAETASDETPDRTGTTFINGKLAERPGEGTQPEEAQPKQPKRS